MRISFDSYFMALAKLAAVRSGCNSRPTGAVIVQDNRVIATGYNGSIIGQRQCTDNGPKYCQHRTKGVDDKGKAKYQDCLSIHAEQNAINYAARYGGVKLNGAKIYCTLFPCVFCLKNLVSVGIKDIYFEIHYSSNDQERDFFWKSLVELYNVNVTQIKLTGEEYSAIAGIMYRETSQRRLL